MKCCAQGGVRTHAHYDALDLKANPLTTRALVRNYGLSSEEITDAHRTVCLARSQEQATNDREWLQRRNMTVTPRRRY